MRITIPVTPELEAYIDAVGYREHHVLAECRAEAQTRGAMAVMQVAPECAPSISACATMIALPWQ